MRVRALVDVEVMVRGERRHLEVDVGGASHFLESLAFEPFENLGGRGLDVGRESADRLGVVIVGLEVTANDLDHGLHVLPDRREDELMAPDRVPAVLHLVRCEAAFDEAPAALGGFQGRDDLLGGLMVEGGDERLIALRLFLHLP